MESKKKPIAYCKIVDNQWEALIIPVFNYPQTAADAQTVLFGNYPTDNQNPRSIMMTVDKQPRSSRKKSCFTYAALSVLVGSVSLTAQDGSNADEDVYELSPFTVEPESGYTAQRTLSGSRLNTELKNVSQSVSIMTEDFLEDMDVLNPEDALLYSLNVENREEFSDAVSSGGNFNSGVAFNDFSGRVRGIDSAGRMRDFFNTNLESDSYNLAGGVSVSSGPNAVIFGIGGTGGVVSTGFKKASASRDENAVDFRTDSEGSFRVSVDLNKVLIDDKLAFRFVALNDDFETYRYGSKGDQERYFFAVTANPWKGGSLNAYYEDVDIHKGLPRNLVAYDGGVTAYMEHVANGGDLYYNNAKGLGTNIDPAWEGIVERKFSARRNTWIHNPDGTQEFAGNLQVGNGPNASAFTVQTVDPSQRDPNPLDRYRWSLPVDSPLVSEALNIHGDTTNRRMTGDIYGAIFTQQLTEDLHIEFGFNRERGMTHFTSMAGPGAAVVRVDPNMYLADGVTDNPYKGMYYVEDWGQSSSDFNDLESFRTTVSWDLDFTEKKLGRHQVLGLYTEDQIDRFWSWMRTKTEQDSDGSGLYDARWQWNQGQTQYRWYLNENLEMVNPWDGFEGGAQDDGSYVWARGNVPASASTWSQLKKEKGATLAVQSFLFDERLVTTLGYRQGWFQDGAATVQSASYKDNVVWGWENIEDVDRSLDTYSPEYDESAVNFGAVYHVTDSDSTLGQISLVYNFADIFTSPTPNHYGDGTRHSSPLGESYDIGVMWQAPSGKFGGKLSYYNTQAENLRSTEWQNFFKNPIQNLERQIGDLVMESFDSSNYADMIAEGLIYSSSANDGQTTPLTLADIANDPNVMFDSQGFDPSGQTAYGMTVDRESMGYEFEGWANPTENLTVRFTAAKGEANDLNIMKGWDTWLETRFEYYKAWATWESTHYEEGDNDPLSEQNNSVADYFATISPGYSTLKSIPAGQGTRVGQNVGLRTNTTVRYTFKKGALKGFDLGATYRYREASVIGYIADPTDDLFEGFPYPSNADNVFTALNLDKPVYGEDREDVDMFLSYRGKFGNGTRYNIRFNVRNVFDDTSVVPQRADSSGNTVIYSFKSPRTYSMSLGLRF